MLCVLPIIIIIIIIAPVVDWPAMGSINIGLVPDASLDLREKTLTEKPRCLTGWVLHPKEAKGENPNRKSPLLSGRDSLIIS